MPEFVDSIIKQVAAQDWFVHALNVEHEDQLYNPAGYLYKAEVYGVEYSICLDLNIYQYVLSAFKKEKISDLHRNAIALMVFAKFTNIRLDPTIAVYEKLNYQSDCPKELIEDLVIFRQIDDADMYQMAMFALGKTDELKLPEPAPLDRRKIESELTKYDRLRMWDSLYLTLLKITELYFFERGLSDKEKIVAFLDWCHKDFLISVVALFFGVKLLGKRQLKRLMKFNPSGSSADKKKSLMNMTWDLYLAQDFISKWRKQDPKREYIYASNDKPLKEVLRTTIEVHAEGFDCLQDDLSDELIQKVADILQCRAPGEGRKIEAASDFGKFRSDLIKELESILISDANA